MWFTKRGSCVSCITHWQVRSLCLHVTFNLTLVLLSLIFLVRFLHQIVAKVLMQNGRDAHFGQIAPGTEHSIFLYPKIILSYILNRFISVQQGHYIY